MRQPDGRVRLANAALLFALDEYPDIDVPAYLRRLTRLAREINAERVNTPQDQWHAMRTVLVDRHGFTGNRADDRNPANGYLNRVMDTRRGIPISLSVIWLDAARTLEWPVRGIGTPGHFLIRHMGMDGDVYIDPYDAGRGRSRAECEQMLRRRVGASVPIGEDAFQPVDDRRILHRMIGNLYAYYVNVYDWKRTATVLSRLSAVVPDEVPVRAELARVLTCDGRFDQAARVLADARDLAVFDADKALVGERATDLRRRLSELN